MSTGKVKLKVKQESDIVDPVIKRAINKANEPKMVGSPPKKVRSSLLVMKFSKMLHLPGPIGVMSNTNC